MHPRDTQSRREFFKLAGVAGSALAIGPVLGGPGSAAEATPEAAKRNSPFALGLASYTLRKFDLDQTLAMTQRVGLTHICLKSFHLPLDASADQISAAVAKIKAAGIDLYGGGVITMKTDKDVAQAFDYAKAAGMRTIVGAPAPDVLPLVNEKVKQFDIEVAIHNHGPGDKVYPTPESIYRRSKSSTRASACASISATRCASAPIRSRMRNDLLIGSWICTSKTFPPQRRQARRSRSAAGSSISPPCCGR
jgi:inosose dehydratase